MKKRTTIKCTACIDYSTKNLAGKGLVRNCKWLGKLISPRTPTNCPITKIRYTPHPKDIVSVLGKQTGNGVRFVIVQRN